MFLKSSAARVKSSQNEELALAVEQLRLRRPDRPWLIPVRLDDCPVPDIDIGAGRTLASIQRADLFGEKSNTGTARLIEAIRRLLAERSPQGGSADKVRFLVRQVNGNPSYSEAYKDVLSQVMSALWTVDSRESADVFVGESDALVRRMARNVDEFYVGEFLNIFKDAVVSQGNSDLAACKQEVKSANVEAESVSVQLTERLSAAMAGGDTAAQHEVWRDREIVQADCRARVDSASKRIDSISLRLGLCEELATKLGFGYS
jgi:hypothetical protein